MDDNNKKLEWNLSSRWTKAHLDIVWPILSQNSFKSGLLQVHQIHKVWALTPTRTSLDRTAHSFSPNTLKTFQKHLSYIKNILVYYGSFAFDASYFVYHHIFIWTKKKHNNISSYTYTYTTQKYVRMLTGLIYVKINQFMPCIFYVNANFFPSFAFVMSNFWFFIHFFVSCLLFFLQVLYRCCFFCYPWDSFCNGGQAYT